ncbi:MAG: hypothetical protein EON90_00460 [Brevundimonas sp.]|nr:MAG: hypothetical protein EON90_00460 [Brevundimonas sp.]
MHIVSVSAIRDALGSRWPRRSAGIEDFVERGFRRGALADDLIVRLNPVDFILVQPSWPPLGALNRAMQLMRDTLSYFLGEVRPENIRVAVVDQLLGDAIQARSVAPTAQAEGSCATLRNLVDSTDGSPPWERFAAGAAMSDPVLVRRPDGGDLEAMFYLEPVWNLASGAVASFLVRSVVFELAPDGTRSPPCWALFTPRCHLALVESRIDYLARELEAEPSLVAHLPISASCLRLTSTRFRLLSKLRRRLPDERRKQTIIELRDLPAGFPESALAALVAQVAPYARAVLARKADKLGLRPAGRRLRSRGRARRRGADARAGALRRRRPQGLSSHGSLWAEPSQSDSCCARRRDHARRRIRPDRGLRLRAEAAPVPVGRSLRISRARPPGGGRIESGRDATGNYTSSTQGDRKLLRTNRRAARQFVACSAYAGTIPTRDAIGCLQASQAGPDIRLWVPTF